MKVVFFGTPEFVSPVLKVLKKDFQLVKVVNSKNWGPDFVNQFKKLEPDLLVVASFGKIIPQEILDIPKFGSLNVHPSLLPKYRGPSPIQAAILAGDKQTGVTIMLMDEKMDHGPILIQKKITISDSDSFESLSTKLFQMGANLLTRTTLEYVAGKIKPRVQNYAIATYCPLVKKQDGYFDINSPPNPETLDRKIRAFYPWPGVWTIWRYAIGDKKIEKIVKFYPSGRVQMEGKKATDLKSFLHGYPGFPIKKLG